MQVMPIEPIGAEPIGIDELIIGGGIAPAAIVGLKTSPRIPPISPRRKPTKNPPREEVAKLMSDSISTMTPHMVWDAGLVYIIMPPRIMIIPKTNPKIPRMATVEPMSGTPVAPFVFPMPEITAPTKAWKTPPNNTKIPPIRDRTKAAVGLSAISGLVSLRSYNI